MSVSCRTYVSKVYTGFSIVSRRAFTVKRSYKDAVLKLNSVQTNHAIIEAVGASGRFLNDQSIPEMIEWCHRTGFSPLDLDDLNCIHVAGTKGKGSTSAFVSSILQQYVGENTTSGQPSHIAGQLAPLKVGLYTSPHLRFVRERIQINGQPLSEEVFAEVFFDVWCRLEAYEAEHPMIGEWLTKPGYFRLLTLMAFHTYLTQGVNAAVIECGIGGEYDSTNVLRPRVAGITSLGIDHTAMLGTNIEQIAWHKAGIMKDRVPAFTVQQPCEAMKVLHARARERNSELKVVDVHPEIASGQTQLGLAGSFQRANASLAVELAAAYLKAVGYGDIDTTVLNEQFVRGLRDVRLSGRCEIRQEINTGITWYIDGAHTVESMEAATSWFAEHALEASNKATQMGISLMRVLVFNQQTRSSAPLLHKLQEVISEKLGGLESFHHAIFTTNATYDKTGLKPDLAFISQDGRPSDDMSVQRVSAKTWETINKYSQVHISCSIEETTRLIRRFSRTANEQSQCRVQVFTVGSTHLVGGILEVLEMENI